MMDMQELNRAMATLAAVGMRVLAARIMVLLALLLTFGLFAYSMYVPTVERIAAATIFGLMTFWLVNSIDRKAKPERDVIAPQGD